MNTYNVSVNGVEILKNIPETNLENNIKILRPLVWVTGGSDEDIKIEENNLKNF